MRKLQHVYLSLLTVFYFHVFCISNYFTFNSTWNIYLTVTSKKHKLLAC